MNDWPIDDGRAALAALVDPVVHAAWLLLVLDERQPDELRAEAITMPAERLCWTLTQLDSGLALDVCQALVRAIRLSHGRPLAPDRQGAEIRSAEMAAGAAWVWLRPHLAALPATVDLRTWLADDGRVAAPTAPSWSALTTPASLAVITANEAVVLTALGALSPPPACSWLHLPPLVGPPPGADGPPLVARILGRLRDAWRQR